MCYSEDTTAETAGKRHQLSLCVQLMNVSGLSRDNVASHLQKHRLGLKRGRARKRKQTDASAPPKRHRRKGAAAAGAAAARVEAAAITAAAAAPDAAATAADGVAAPDDAKGTPPAAPPAAAAGDACTPAQWADQEGSNEREGSNPRVDDGSCEPDDRNAVASNRRAFGELAGSGSDDGAGAGSDNRHSACVEHVSATLRSADGATTAAAGPVPRRTAGGEAETAACAGDTAGGTATPPELSVARQGSNDANKASADDTKGSAGSGATAGSGNGPPAPAPVASAEAPDGAPHASSAPAAM